MSHRRRAGWATLALGGAVLLAGWGAGWFRGAPPIYDGLPLSAEPYRYLNPPPGFATTAPPSAVTETVTVGSGPNAPTLTLNTTEAPPQASLVFSTSAFPDPGQRVMLAITPVPPPSQPGGGHIDGNVYEFAATRGIQDVGLRRGQTVNVGLRGTGAEEAPVIERLDPGGWHRLPTTHVPPDQYVADSDRMGDFALVASGAVAGGASPAVTAGIVAGAVVAGLGVVVALLRRVRRRGSG